MNAFIFSKNIPLSLKILALLCYTCREFIIFYLKQDRQSGIVIAKTLSHQVNLAIKTKQERGNHERTT